MKEIDSASDDANKNSKELKALQVFRGKAEDNGKGLPGLSKVKQKQLESLNKFLGRALALDEQEAKAAGALGFMAQLFVLASLPHRKPEGQEFTRRNGNYSLTLLSKKDVGLPYGSMPRLLLSWVTTEAVKRKSRELYLGDNLSEFMRTIGVEPKWGRGGTVGRFNSQMKKLFSAFISCSFEDNRRYAVENIKIAKSFKCWWDLTESNQPSLFESVLTLDEEFYKTIINTPIPVDMRALSILKKSPMALDIYTWLTYRMSFLKHNTSIPFESLRLQFGASIGRPRDFRAKFIQALGKVVLIYPDLKLDYDKKNLILKPSPTHIKKLKK